MKPKQNQFRRCPHCNHRMPSKTASRCHSCRLWSFFTPDDKPKELGLEDDGTTLLSNAPDEDYQRIPTGPWDACFGGGIVVSGVSLLGGPPGVGKSTIACQLSCSILRSNPGEILYVAAEEGTREIRPRVKRLGFNDCMDRFRLIPIGSDADMIPIIAARKPKAIIIDSLQGFTQDLNEQSEILHALKPIAVEYRAPFIVISQVNKDEDFAGLMTLQHAVDTLITFSILEDMNDLREMKPRKNRHGPTGSEQIRYFEMTEKGLLLVDLEDEDEDGDS